MRFVRQLSHGMMDGLRFRSNAMAALQEEAENLLIREFESIPSCELRITMYILTAHSDESLCDPRKTGDYPAQGYAAGSVNSTVHDRLQASRTACGCAALMEALFPLRVPRVICHFVACVDISVNNNAEALLVRLHRVLCARELR